jgi:hypothetical protein
LGFHHHKTSTFFAVFTTEEGLTEWVFAGAFILRFCATEFEELTREICFAAAGPVISIGNLAGKLVNQIKLSAAELLV